MKKLQEILRPFFAIIFGALLLLFYFNYLSMQGAALAIGIIAVILAAFYLTYGILNVVAGTKLPEGFKKIFDLLAMTLFPTFFFVEILLVLINAAQIENYLGPNAWLIAILSLIGTLAFIVIYIIAFFSKNSIVNKLANLFAFIFILILLLHVLFDTRGDAIALGGIDVIAVVIYVAFSSMLLRSLNKPEASSEEAPSSEEPKEE